MTRQGLEANLWKCYVFHSLTKSMGFVVPVIVLFWQEHGLSMTQIMILQSIFSILIVLLEIPSGYFADIHERRQTMFLGACALVLGVLVYCFAAGFWEFLAAEVCLAVGMSFISGADSALIFDTLKELGRESEYKVVWGRVVFYWMFALAVFCSCGGVLGSIYLRLPILFSLLFLLPTLPLIWSMVEPRRHKLIVKEGNARELLRIVKYALVGNRQLSRLILYFGMIYAFTQAVLWFYQPYFTLCGLEMHSFGLIFAAYNIFSALSSKVSHRAEVFFGAKNSMLLLPLVLAASYLLMGYFVFPLAFAFGFLQQMVRGFSQVVFSDYLNKLCDSDIRATVLSVNNMSFRLIYACIIPFIGWMADAYSIQACLLATGFFLLPAGLLCFFLLGFKKDS